jgi:hypothetical protein
MLHAVICLKSNMYKTDSVARIVILASLVAIAAGLATVQISTKDDCCLEGRCCSGMEYCCNECDGSCTCSVHGKCHSSVIMTMSAKANMLAYPKKMAAVLASKEDCCLEGRCCSGMEYCCNECDGSCRCSVHGKCNATRLF